MQLAHRPPEHRPAQHSSRLAHALPRGLQGTHFLAAQVLPTQHSALAMHESPSFLQVVHSPPEHSPEQHSSLTSQALPSVLHFTHREDTHARPRQQPHWPVQISPSSSQALHLPARQKSAQHSKLSLQVAPCSLQAAQELSSQ
jgi:hypothetical protein